MFGRTAKKDDAAPVSDEAAAAAPASEFVTRAECSAMIAASVDAAIVAQAIVNREIATGSRDAFFSVSRLENRLSAEARSDALPEAIARCLQLCVDAMGGNAAKEYGVDRGAPGQLRIR